MSEMMEKVILVIDEQLPAEPGGVAEEEEDGERGGDQEDVVQQGGDHQHQGLTLNIAQ